LRSFSFAFSYAALLVLTAGSQAVAERHLRHSAGCAFQQAKAREDRRILPQRNRDRKDSRRDPVEAVDL
jgi:hypothetical protein